MRRDDQAMRDCEIVLERLSGDTTRQVAEGFGVSPRTVRRVMQRFHEGKNQLSEEALGPLARVYPMLVARLRELQDAHEQSQDAEERRALIEAQLALAPQLLDLGRALGKPVGRPQRMLKVDELREFNGRLREVLSKHCVPTDVIDEATDVNIDPFFAGRGLDLRAIARRAARRLHFGRHDERLANNLRDRLAHLGPDMIVCTGDLADDANERRTDSRASTAGHLGAIASRAKRERAGCFLVAARASDV